MRATRRFPAWLSGTWATFAHASGTSRTDCSRTRFRAIGRLATCVTDHRADYAHCVSAKSSRGPDVGRVVLTGHRRVPPYSAVSATSAGEGGGALRRRPPPPPRSGKGGGGSRPQPEGRGKSGAERSETARAKRAPCGGAGTLPPERSEVHIGDLGVAYHRRAYSPTGGQGQCRQRVSVAAELRKMHSHDSGGRASSNALAFNTSHRKFLRRALSVLIAHFSPNAASRVTWVSDPTGLNSAMSNGV